MVQLLNLNSKRPGRSQGEHPFKQFKSDTKPTNKGQGYEAPTKWGQLFRSSNQGEEMIKEHSSYQTIF